MILTVIAPGVPTASIADALSRQNAQPSQLTDEERLKAYTFDCPPSSLQSVGWMTAAYE